MTTDVLLLYLIIRMILRVSTTILHYELLATYTLNFFYLQKNDFIFYQKN